MALTKPILYNIDAFDATKPQAFTFESIGGDQVVANQLTIINQSTGNIVYQRKQITNAFFHNVTANVLTNGSYYLAYIVTYNIQDEVSSQSVGIQFRCYETASWNFTNITEDGIVNNSIYVFNVRYFQPQSEKLSEVTFNLYDNSKNLIDTSTSFVGMPLLVNYCDVTYKIDGLNNTFEYYIQAIGITEHGMKLDTGLIHFRAEYEVPLVYNVVELTNECEKGYVDATINAISIKGTSSPINLKYVSGNTAVLQDGNDNYITWEENLHFSDNYRVLLWGRNFYTLPTLNLFQLHITDDNREKIIIYIDELDANTYRMEGLVYNSDGQLIDTVYSNELTISSMNLLQQLIIEKNNGIYTLQYKLKQEYTTTAVIGRGIIGCMIIGNEGV